MLFLVISGGRTSCQGDDGQELLLTSPSTGYLSSLTAEETGCGDDNHPWILRADSGQIILIKLVDFAHAANDLLMTGTCTVYAIIKVRRDILVRVGFCSSNESGKYETPHEVMKI